MRGLGFMIAGVLFGLSALAQAETFETGHVLKKLEDNLIVTVDDARVTIYGVRLVDEKTNVSLYLDARQFILNSLNGLRFSLETGEFRKSGSLHNRYGDLQGRIITADGEWLQEALIAEGYGWWDASPKYPPEFRERLLVAEKRAAERELGLWREFSVLDANQPPNRYWDGQFIIAKGVVLDVYKSSSTTYLNFGEDWRTDFTAAISSTARKKFEHGDWKLADLKSKSVRVRGLVRFYNGPYLELEFPEQLEIQETAGEG